MMPARCSEAGKDNYKNKTPPHGRRRNEESCGHRGRVLNIEVIVEPVVVPVPRTVVPVQIADVQVVVGVAICAKSLQYHCPSSTLRAVSYS